MVYRQYCLLLAPKHLLKNYFFPTYSIETLFTCIKLIISSQLVLYNLLIRRVDTTFQNSSNSLVSNSSCKFLLRTYSIETLFTSVENLPSSTKSCWRVSYSNEAGMRRNKTLATFISFSKDWLLGNCCRDFKLPLNLDSTMRFRFEPFKFSTRFIQAIIKIYKIL